MTSAAVFLWYSRHTAFSFPPKHNAVPLLELLFSASLFGQFLLILNFHIKYQCFRDTLPGFVFKTMLGLPYDFYTLFLILLITILSNYLCDYYLLNSFLPTRALRGKYWFSCVCPWICSTHHGAWRVVESWRILMEWTKGKTICCFPTKTILCFCGKIYIMLWVNLGEI